MDKHQVAVVVGVGHGLGYALARRFAAAEMHVALAARDATRLETMAIECSGVNHDGRAYACDATSESAVEALFAQVQAELGPADVVVYNVSAFVPKGLLETSAAEFERCWRAGCLGGFLVGRAAALQMLKKPIPGGTILFTGATASLRGSAGYQNLAVGKFGLRALAQSMARELQPKGIHIAHIIIDGRIRPSDAEPRAGEAPDDMLAADAIADNYLRLHCQGRSAWTQELDLRPWLEKF